MVTGRKFGPLVWQDIGPHLRMMLLSCSKSDWDQSYNHAAKLLQSHPMKLEKLDKIYGNPKYYAGYYLRNKVGNLHLNGSTASEQNHLSTQACIGPSGQGNSIMDHVCAFVKREAEKMKKMKRVMTCYIAVSITINLQSKAKGHWTTLLQKSFYLFMPIIICVLEQQHMQHILRLKFKKMGLLMYGLQK